MDTPDKKQQESTMPVLKDGKVQNAPKPTAPKAADEAPEREPKHLNEALMFRDPVGLDGTFNTFRRGDKWAKAAEVGDTVDLVEVVEGGEDKPIGKAEITGIHTGKYADLQTMAVDNHFSAARGFTADAGEMLGYELQRVYDDENALKGVFTVLYLRRI